MGHGHGRGKMWKMLTQSERQPVCAMCKKPFLRRWPNQLYCSRRCKLDVVKLQTRKRLGIDADGRNLGGMDENKDTGRQARKSD